MIRVIAILFVFFPCLVGAEQEKDEPDQELLNFLSYWGVFYHKEDGTDPVPELLDCLAYLESGKMAEDIVHSANACMEKKGFRVEYLRHQS
ncbi:hypothetical protein [Simiduia agarivorans]|uniref:Uncharacterized protein n=1 Tax=Simiduia agarivorans (strain DSM 21679 / JCM 13881 / BCRC 17597 / SA1) TaxID=1117647 RepID=K4KMR4_SIMAS|nr:hypothetical protein [Simiduia agarivorans]AFU99515.1 hypothetical protein M5M_11690 [Simiduia agarivorans SA1 = DSM 21679]